MYVTNIEVLSERSVGGCNGRLVEVSLRFTRFVTGKKVEGRFTMMKGELKKIRALKSGQGYELPDYE